MNMNQTIVIGKLVKITDFGMVLVTKRDINPNVVEEEANVPITLNDKLLNMVKLYCSKGDLIAVKGHVVGTDENDVKIIGDKISFLSLQKKEED